MSEKSKIPSRSHAQKDIIQFLMTSKTLTFTELQVKLGLSRPALSRHLSALLDDGTVEFTKKGREKHYNIKNSIKIKLERRLMLLQSHYKLDFLLELEKKPKSIHMFKEYKKIGDWMNSYFLFLVIKSLQTGENWTEGFDPRGFAFITTNYLLSILYDTDKMAPVEGWVPFTKEHLDKTFNEINKEIKKAKLDNRLDDMMNLLNKAYPDSTKSIEDIMKRWTKKN